MGRFAILYCYGVPKWENRGSQVWASALSSSLLGELGEEEPLEKDLFDPYDVTKGEYPSPDTLLSYTALVITGSPSGVYDPLPWIPPLLQFIRTVTELQGGPRLLGGCFGAQAICQALGGYVESTGKFVIKAENIVGVVNGASNLTPEPLQGIARVLNAGHVRLLEAHGDACITLPPTALHLGTSQSCKHEVFAVKNSRGEWVALAFQSHPEFGMEDIKERVFPRVAHRLSEEEKEEAMGSWGLERHEREVCREIKRFLVGGKV